MSQTLIGEQRRRQTRVNQINSVKKRTRQLFDKVFTNPDRPPSESDFTVGWEKFTQSLMDTFGKRKDFRLAFKHGENIVKNHQINNGWPYSPASQIVINKPDTQLRSPEWLNQAWALYDAYENWLRTQGHQSTKDLDFRYQSLILSFIFDSGHAYHEVVKAFNRRLQENTAIKLHHFGQYVFMDLVLDTDTLNTNDNLNGDKVTTIQCFLSLKTLAQLNLWQKINKNDWMYPTDSTKLYKKIIHNLGSPSKLPTTLKQFCSISIFWYERHSNTSINEALLEYRIGRTRSYSLPTTNLIRLIAPTIHPVLDVEFSQFSTDVAIKRQQTNTAPKGTTLLINNQLTRELKMACKPILNSKKVSSKTICENLEKLLNKYKLELWQQVFIQWLMSKSKSCTAKTVNQYMLNQIKYWYLMNEDNGLSKINDSVELEELYSEQISNHSTDKSQRYYSSRLKDLHAFAGPLLNLPTLSDRFFHIDATQKHTRAGLVDEPLFKALLVHIHQLTDLNETEKLALQTICIISYRCGLRINELNKLLIENIEESKTGWISVRPNRFGDNKTPSALRQVPLFPLLLEDENRIVSDYLRHKRGQKVSQTAPLLTMGIDLHRPFDLFSVSNYVGRLLKALSGETHLVFHHLRHSCLSRLQVMLEIENPVLVLPYFYPYSKAQTNKIKKLLFKKTLCKGYWEIAQFAGHESPKVTFEHYFHLSDMLSSKLIEQQDESHITRTDAQQAGLCTRRQFQEIKKTLNKVTYISCYPNLLESLNSIEIKPDLTTLSRIDELELPSKKLINLTVCYQTLEAISLGESIEDLSYRFRLDQEDIDNWMKNANYLKSLKTSISNKDKQNSRHFSPQRIYALVPGKLKTQKELNYIDGIIKKLRNEYNNEEKKEAIQEMMLYSLTHTSVSKSGVNFHSPEKLRQFIEIFHFAIPFASWRAVELYIDNSTIKSQWKETLKKIKTIEEKKGSPKGRPAKGSVRLELISPNEPDYIKNGSVTKYSSHLLIYLMYMSYVMIHHSTLKK